MINKKKLVDRINLGYQAAKRWHDSTIFPECYDNHRLYIGKVPKKKYKSEANFHVPYVATLVDSVWPLLTARMPFAKVEGRNPERDYNAADLMNELIEYTYDVTNFELTFLLWQKDSMKYPTSWVKVIWDYSDEKTDHPDITLLDTYRVLPHPKKLKLDDRWPIYQVTEMTKAEMREMGWDKEAINELGDSKLETADFRRKMMEAYGYRAEEENDSDKSDTLYEVVEAWGKMQLDDNEEAPERMSQVIMANGEKILNPKPIGNKKLFESPYEHDYFPYVPLNYNKDNGFFHGQSLISTISSQQKELNALENMKADNYKRRNNPPLKIRRNANIDLSTLKFVNSAPWLVNEPDDITQELIADLAPSIENQQQMVRSTMQNRVGANDVLLVTDDVNIKGGNTYGGAAIANENTKLRFRPQSMLIDAAIRRVGEICISLYQDKNLFDREKAIAIADKEGNTKLQTIKPSDIKGELVYRVESASTLAESDESKLTKLLNIKELYVENTQIKQDELDREIFTAAHLDYETLFKTKEEMAKDLNFKLKELIATAQSPDFQANTPQGQQVLAQIDKIKTMIGGGAPAQENTNQPMQPNQGEEMSQQ